MNDKVFFVIWGVCAVLGVAFWVGVAVVAVHFASKWW